MDLNSAVFQALALALGLDPADPEASRRIRRAYVSPSPPPPPADRDTLYYHLMPDGSVRPLEESETCEGFPCFFRFAPYRLLLAFYGPSAESLAWRVYHRLYLDGYRSPRRALRAAGIYPVPDPPGPVFLFEEWEKEHRPRVDLTIPLRIAAAESDSARPADLVEVPPDVLMHI